MENINNLRNLLINAGLHINLAWGEQMLKEQCKQAGLLDYDVVEGSVVEDAPKKRGRKPQDSITNEQ